jgi:hypothetical protein
MNPINFKEHNVIYKAEGCNDLPAHKGKLEIISCWQPDEEELEEIKKQINNGEVPKFYLSLYGHTQVPVWVGAVSPFAEEGVE